MKTSIILCALVGFIGCSPTGPTLTYTSFQVQVMQANFQPMPGLSVTLYNGETALNIQTTDAQGVVSWKVPVGARYHIVANDEIFFGATSVVGPCRWVAITSIYKYNGQWVLHNPEDRRLP